MWSLCRTELSTQLSQLTAELSTTQTSFEALQDFVQLPLVFIWQQQFRKVIHQALAQELSSLPHSLQAESRQQGLLRQALQHSPDTMTHQPPSARGPLHKQAAAFSGHARQRDRASVSRPATTCLSDTVYVQTDTQPISAKGLSDSAQTGLLETAPEPHLLSQQPAYTAAAQGLLHGTQEEEQMGPPALASLPALARPPSRQTSLPTPAGQGALPEQATQRSLPKQATPVQPTFLRMCLAEVLRLTNPAQSQFQPLFCGWYTSGLTLPTFACHSQQQHSGYYDIVIHKAYHNQRSALHTQNTIFVS